MTSATFIDVLILLWLVATWFYDGHHKKCRVKVVCPHCGQQTDQVCLADERNHK